MKPSPAVTAFLLLFLAACSNPQAPVDSAAPGKDADSPSALPGVSRSADPAAQAPAGAADESGNRPAVANASPVITEVPARFRGLYAQDARACAEDYSYNPAFQNVTVGAREVRFFETGGPVTNVNVSDDAIAITLRETVGDGQFDRAIYLALVDERTARYRPSASEPVKIYVRCQGQ